MDKLKPCPFCGSSAEIYQSDNDHEDWRIFCGMELHPDNNCILGGLDWGITAGNYKTKEEAIKAWNTRINE